jgi:hypothetical protein
LQKSNEQEGYWLGSDCDGIEAMARIEEEFLPCCIGKRARGSEKLFDMIPKVFFLPHY